MARLIFKSTEHFLDLFPPAEAIGLTFIILSRGSHLYSKHSSAAVSKRFLDFVVFSDQREVLAPHLLNLLDIYYSQNTLVSLLIVNNQLVKSNVSEGFEGVWTGQCTIFKALPHLFNFTPGFCFKTIVFLLQGHVVVWFCK